MTARDDKSVRSLAQHILEEADPLPDCRERHRIMKAARELLAVSHEAPTADAKDVTIRHWTERALNAEKDAKHFETIYNNLQRVHCERLEELQAFHAARSSTRPITDEFAEFIGRLSDLAHTSSFWQEKPYGNRLYYGIGGGDYIAKDVLHAFLHALKSSAPSATRLRAQEFAWLIETRPAGIVLYWHGKPGTSRWETDATKAVRFPSKEAAQWAITANQFYDSDVCGYPKPNAVEHGFIYADSSSG